MFWGQRLKTYQGSWWNLNSVNNLEFNASLSIGNCEAIVMS